MIKAFHLRRFSVVSLALTTCFACTPADSGDDGDGSDKNGGEGEGEGEEGEGEGEGELPPLDTAFATTPADGKNSDDSGYALSCNNAPCTFACSLDGGDFVACEAEGAFVGLTVGTHTLAARATDADNRSDDTPVTATFTLSFGFREISQGSNSNCALSGDLQVYCWGSGAYGALGDGINEEHAAARPTLASALPAARYQHVYSLYYGHCAVTEANEHYCFGYSNHLLPGFADDTYLQPVLVEALAPFHNIKTGYSHACALDAEQHLWCWGEDYDEQVGNGVGNSGEEQFVASPTQIGDRRYINVSMSSYGTCAIEDTGALWCWGNNYNGSAGQPFEAVEDQDPPPVAVPTQVGTATTWVTIASGDYHTCGVHTDGSLWCFGDNYDGQIGSDLPSSVAPIQVGTDTDWFSVGASDSSTCASRDSGTFCFGDNLDGQLGSTELYVERTATPTAISYDGVLDGLAGARGATFCGLSDGDIVCFGRNLYPNGILGRGVLGTQNAFLEIDAGWSKIAVNTDGGCGIQSGGLYCWGLGMHVAQSGVPLFHEPVRVGTSSSWTDISMYRGGDLTRSHTCGIDDGSLYCWGLNTDGQLGIGNAGSAALPEAVVVPDTRFRQVSTGFNSTCAVTEDDHLYCFGGGVNGFFPVNYGQVGDGTSQQRNTPTAVTVPAADGWASVDVVDARVTARRTDGTMWGFGSNVHSTPMLLPRQIGDAADWRAVASTTQRSSCGIKTDGTLWCGSLEFFSNVWDRDLTQVDSNSDYVDLFDSPNGVCALTDTDAVRCFVNNSNATTWTPMAGYPDNATPWPAASLMSLVGGYEFHCALTTEGQRLCGGRREKGNFGDGFDERWPAPVLLPE